MNTFTVATEETPTTQATEKIFIHGMPVTYTPPNGSPQQATYDEGFRHTYIDKHTINLVADGTSVVVNSSDITPNRSLTDEEMVAHLTEQMFEIGATVDRQVKTISTLYNDHDKISTALKEEAENRGWCKEYNTFCEEVNSTLEMSELLPLEQEYPVNTRTKAEVEVDHVVYVTATSQEHADSMVEDNPNMFFDPEEVALDHVKNHGFDSYDIELI